MMSLNICFSRDELSIPVLSENNGQNKYERISGVEKHIITLFEAENESRRDYQELLTQVNLLKKDFSKTKEEKEKATKENIELRNEVTELKKNITDLKRSLDQIRISVYGEEGKKEKDELLLKR